MNAPGDRIELALAGERVALLAERALFWPRERTLFIADPHFGKGNAFRRRGIALPDDTGEELARLSRLLAGTAAERLVVLGDFLHARAGRAEGLEAALAEWRAQHSALEVVLVRGNHDRSAGDPAPELGVRCVEGPWACGPFAARHEPAAGAGRHALCGHLHPAFTLRERGGASLRCPCFWLRAEFAVLPAFGALTGTASIRAEAGDRVILAGEGRVIEVAAG